MDVIEALPIGAILNDVPAAMDLLRQHPRFDEKTSGGTLRIVKSWKLVVVDSNGNPVHDFGWTKALRASQDKPVGFSPKGRAEKAARNLIHGQLQWFRRQHNLGSDVELDHVGRTLSQLLADWLAETGITTDNIPLCKSRYTGYTIFGLREHRTSWKAYHREHAQLAPISKQDHVEKNMGVYHQGFRLKRGELTKSKMSTICKSLSELWDTPVIPEPVADGFLFVHSSSGCKSIRLHSASGSWPFIAGGEVETWEGNDEVIYLDLSDATTTISVPGWTREELFDIVRTLEGVGIQVKKLTIPRKKELLG